MLAIDKTAKNGMHLSQQIINRTYVIKMPSDVYPVSIFQLPIATSNGQPCLKKKMKINNNKNKQKIPTLPSYPSDKT